MINIIRKVFFLLLLSFSIYSCSDPNKFTKPIDDHKYLINDTKGSYVIYEINQLNFKINGTIDSSTFYLKEVVGDTVNLGGIPAYKLLRYTQNDINEDKWKIDSVWYAYKSNNQWVKVENNFKYIKLVFPLQNNSSWNSNALNSKEAQNVKIKNLDSKFLVNQQILDKTTSIVISDSLPVNKINRNFSVEVYAPQIGLIYKDYQIYTYDQSPGNLGKFIIQTGTHFTQKIISHGNE